MSDWKFLTLLHTLTERELTAFQRYLKRLHGDEAIALAVFRHIRKLRPDLINGDKLDLAAAHKKIFRTDITANDYNRTKMLNALSDLNLWLREFLLWEKAKADSFESRALWLMILRERGLDAEYFRQTSRLHAEVKAFPKKGIMDYMKSIAANHFFYYHRAQDSLSPDIDALRLGVKDLDLYYAVTRLKLACEIANLKNQFSLEFDLEALPKVLEWGENPPLWNSPLLLLYREIYQLIAADEEERYARISALLTEQVHTIDPDEILVMLSYLHNYAALQIRKGKEDYWRKTHELNKFGIDHRIFMRKDIMSGTQFNNIVNIACRVKDFDWAESFINAQSKFLPADVRNDTTLLAKSLMLFEKTDFRQVLALLEPAGFKDVNDTIRARALLLRSYYECQADMDMMLEYCNAFDIFLRRNRKSRKAIVIATLNFLRLIKMLIRKKADKEQIVREISQAESLYFKSWLIEKAAVYKAEFAAHKRKK